MNEKLLLIALSNAISVDRLSEAIRSVQLCISLDAALDGIALAERKSTLSALKYRLEQIQQVDKDWHHDWRNT